MDWHLLMRVILRGLSDGTLPDTERLILAIDVAYEESKRDTNVQSACRNSRNRLAHR